MSAEASGGWAGGVPGSTDAYFSQEQTVAWGGYAYQLNWFDGIINANAVDSGNTPTIILRPGLLMGLQLSSMTWFQYNPLANDGTQIAAAIFVVQRSMWDPLANAVAPRYAGMVAAGPVKASSLIGLDGQARSQMRGRFLFDDDLVGRNWYPPKFVNSQSANYAVLATDIGALLLVPATASGAVTFTLPANTSLGQSFSFLCEANQTMAITSFEGTNVIAPNNASASTITFSTANLKIGSSVDVWNIYDGAAYKWMYRLNNGNTATIS